MLARITNPRERALSGVLCVSVKKKKDRRLLDIYEQKTKTENTNYQLKQLVTNSKKHEKVYSL